MSYGNAIPIRLKDSSDVTKGLQRFNSSDEDYLAHKVGPLLVQSDSNNHGALGIFRYDSTALGLGTLVNTILDQNVGAGGNSSVTITQDNTTLYRTNRQTQIAQSATIGGINHFHPASMDSDGKGRMVISEMDSDQFGTLVDRINGKVIDSDLIGVYKLAVGSSSGGSQSGYTEVLPNFFGDTIRDSADSSSNLTNYSIWQRTSGTTTPSTRKPLFFKRGDSDEVPVPNVQFYRDSTAPHDSAGASVFNFQRNDILKRPVVGFRKYTTDSAGANSAFNLYPDKKTLVKLFGNHNNTTSENRMSRFKTNYLITDNSSLDSANATFSASDRISFFSGRSDSDAIGYSENKLRGVKIKTKRFSNVADYGGVTSAIRNSSAVQNLKDSNGYHTFEVLFDKNTKFNLKSFDSASHGYGMGSGFYQSNTGSRWQNRFPVEGSSYLEVDSAGFTNVSSATRTLIDAIKTANSGILPAAFDANPLNNSNSMGALDSDQISLLTFRDFKGLQEMDSDAIRGSIGGRARLRMQFPDRVGSYAVLSAVQGTPLDNGFTGTWVAKGTATDTRRVVADTQNYTRDRTENFSRDFEGDFAGEYSRTRSSNYLRLRTSNYTRDFVSNRVTTRTSSYSAGFLGNYSRNFTRNSTNTFTGNFTRTSTYSSGFIGNFTGDYTGNIAYTGDFVGDYQQTASGHAAGTTITASPLGHISTYSWRQATIGGQQVAGYWGGGYKTYTNSTSTVQYYIAFNSDDDGEGDYYWDYAVFALKPSTTATFWIDGNGGCMAPTISVGGVSQNISTSTKARAIHYECSSEDFNYPNFPYSSSVSSLPLGTYPTYTRTSTRTSNVPTDYSRNRVTNYTGNFARVLTFTQDFTGDFTGNFAGEFTRISPGNFARDFVGDYTGDFTRTRASLYTRDSVFLAYQNYTRVAQVNYVSDYVGNYVGNFTRVSVSNAGNDIVAYLGPDPAASFYGDTGEYEYLGPARFTGNYGRIFAANYTRTFVGDFTGNYSRVLARTATLSFAREFIGNYTDDFQRTRSSAFLATEGFSRDFEGNFEGNFAGDFTRNFEGNYARGFEGAYAGAYVRDFIGDFTGNFIGNYTGGIITTPTEIINTYTLYAKKA